VQTRVRGIERRQVCAGTDESGHSGRQVADEEGRRVSEAGADRARGQAGGQGTRAADGQGRSGDGRPDGGRAEGKRGKVTSGGCRAAGDDGPRAVRGGEGNAGAQGGELRGVGKSVPGRGRAGQRPPRQRAGRRQNRVAQVPGADQRVPAGRTAPVVRGA